MNIYTTAAVQVYTVAATYGGMLLIHVCNVSLPGGSAVMCRTMVLHPAHESCRAAGTPLHESLSVGEKAKARRGCHWESSWASNGCEAAVK
eukprot:7058784-Prymnesium_polylepis.2